eukprot:jgi/Mesvir1/18489/Mv14334-RA.1
MGSRRVGRRGAAGRHKGRACALIKRNPAETTALTANMATQQLVPYGDKDLATTVMAGFSHAIMAAVEAAMDNGLELMQEIIRFQCETRKPVAVVVRFDSLAPRPEIAFEFARVTDAIDFGYYTPSPSHAPVRMARDALMLVVLVDRKCQSDDSWKHSVLLSVPVHLPNLFVDAPKERAYAKSYESAAVLSNSLIRLKEDGSSPVWRTRRACAMDGCSYSGAAANKCGGCLSARYCGRECQRGHVKSGGHCKGRCSNARRARDALLNAGAPLYAEMFTILGATASMNRCLGQVYRRAIA